MATQNILYRNGIDFSNQSGITGLKDPSTNDPSGAVSVNFLKNYTEGLKDPKDTCLVGIDSNVVGTYNATNKTLTLTANGVFVGDSITIPINERIFLFGQTDGTQNGIYDLTDTGSVSTPAVLTRSADFNTSNLVSNGAYAWIASGTYANTQLFLSTANPIVLDTTALTFSIINALNNLVATAPILKTGNTLSLQYDSSTLQVSINQLKISSGYVGQTSLTTLGTITTGTWNAGIIPILYGGTGASTISGAKANFGWASSGANSDITSLTGLTTALSIAQGGTGGATAVQARNNIGAIGKYSQDVASGSTIVTINHQLNTTDLTNVFIWDKVTNKQVHNVVVDLIDVDNISLNFGFATTNICRVTVSG